MYIHICLYIHTLSCAYKSINTRIAHVLVHNIMYVTMYSCNMCNLFAAIPKSSEEMHITAVNTLHSLHSGSSTKLLHTLCPFRCLVSTKCSWILLMAQDRLRILTMADRYHAKDGQRQINSGLFPTSCASQIRMRASEPARCNKAIWARDGKRERGSSLPSEDQENWQEHLYS